MATRPWSPLDLPAGSLVGWYDPNDGATVTQSAGSVSQVLDKSGAGNVVTQTTAARQPTLVAAQNGLNVLRCGGKYLNTGILKSIANASAFSMFSVCSRVGSNNDAIGEISDSIGTPNRVFSVFTEGVWKARAGSPGGEATTVANAVAGYHIIGGETTAALRNIYVDGTAGNSSTSTKTFNPANYFFLASLSSSGGNYVWSGDIGEFLLCNAVLSTADRQCVEGYLAAKWGMQGLLPANHPYKSAAPTVTTADTGTARRRSLILMAS